MQASVCSGVCDTCEVSTPDLAVEVLSRSTERHDRLEKLEWYGRYGVRECWLVDPEAEYVEIVDVKARASARRMMRGSDPLRSAVVPEFTVPVSRFFR